MSEAYPLPAYAANVWIAGDKLVLQFPPTAGHTRSHEVRLPADERGLKVLLALLQERSRAEFLTIGHTAAPVQYDVDAILRAMGNTQAPKITKLASKHKSIAPETLSLEDLGL